MVSPDPTNLSIFVGKKKMKTTLLTTAAFLLLSLIASAQNPTCYPNPDGVDGSGWSYKDYIIPSGFKLDSVYMDASRPGYAISDYDMVIESCQGTSIYNHSVGTYPFLFASDPNSEYNVWHNLTSFNYSSIGMVRVSLPTGSGAIWNEVCFAISPKISPTCFATPDGIDGNGWSYKDYIIPSGYRLDSVLMDATRPGYAVSDYDFVLESCQGSVVYNHSIGTYPFLFSTDNNSEYVWINLTSFNYTSIGMVRAALPTNAGAIWNQVCFAISPQITTSIRSNTAESGIVLFPNPAFEKIAIENIAGSFSLEIFDSSGRRVKHFENASKVFDISDLPKGLYLAKIQSTDSKLKTINFVKD